MADKRVPAATRRNQMSGSSPHVKLPYSSPRLVTHVIHGFTGFPTAPASPENPSTSQPAKPMTDETEFEEPRIEQRTEGHTLYQEGFFFCTVPSVGDVSGTGCIYVEVVVDRDAGIAFAKVYAAKNAMNAVEILSTGVFPFFKRKGFAIRNIHTPQKPEYFGLVPLHPFETLLATSHVQHLPTDSPGAPYGYLCLQFYRFLQKEFFRPALRKKFNFSLEELQKELDEFIDAHNALQLSRSGRIKNPVPPAAKFPFDL